MPQAQTLPGRDLPRSHVALQRLLLTIVIIGTLLLFYTLEFRWLPSPSLFYKEQKGSQAIAQRIECDPDKIEQTKNIAIVGAGAAGASAAYYLRKFESPCQPFNITIYERSSYVGGRSTTVDVYNNPNEPVELGASIFVKVNRNLVSAAEELGLSYRTRASREPLDSPHELGVWDGTEFKFLQPKGEATWKTISKLLWKYGLAPFRTHTLMKETVGNFLKLYDEPHFPFRSLSTAAELLALLGATSQHGDQFLAANKIGPPFSTDIIQASTRVNYAQNLNQLHGLETMVCMATDGAMAIQDGNWRIFDGMIRRSRADLHLSTTVTAIEKQADDSFAVKFQLTSDIGPLSDGIAPESSRYDSVILATPFQFADISLSPPPPLIPPKVDYVKLYVTLLTSPHALSGSYFNLEPQTAAPDTILTTLPNSSSGSDDDGARTHSATPFFSISTLRRLRNPSLHNRPEFLYKIFSPAPVTATLLAELLSFPAPPPLPRSNRPQTVADVPPEHIGWAVEKAWDSYPYLVPRVAFDDAGPELDAAGLWYTAGMEPFISTMETSSLMGMNVARLAVDGWELARARAPTRTGQPSGLAWEQEPDKAEL